MTKNPLGGTAAPKNVNPSLWALAQRPTRDEIEVWRALDRETRRRMITSFFETAKGEDIDRVLKRAAKTTSFRARTLRSRSPAKLAEFFEQSRPDAAVVWSFMLQWAQEHPTGIFDLFFQGVAASADDDAEDVVDSPGFPIHTEQVSPSAHRVFGAANIDDTILFTQLFYSNCGVMRSGLDHFYNVLTSQPLDVLDVLKAKCVEMLDTWRFENSENASAESGQDYAQERVDDADTHDGALGFEDLHTLDELRDAFELLRSGLTAIGEKIREAGQSLAEQGRLVEQHLLVDTLSQHHRYRAFCTRLRELGEEKGIEIPDDAMLLSDMRAPETVFVGWAAREVASKQYDAVAKLLARVQLLRHLDDPDFQPLRAVHDAAIHLMDGLFEGTAAATEVEALEAGTHGIAVLLDAVQRISDADGREQRLLSANVAAAFTHELALALVLGQIVFDEAMAVDATANGLEAIDPRLAESSIGNPVTVTDHAPAAPDIDSAAIADSPIGPLGPQAVSSLDSCSDEMLNLPGIELDGTTAHPGALKPFADAPPPTPAIQTAMELRIPERTAADRSSQLPDKTLAATEQAHASKPLGQIGPSEKRLSSLNVRELALLADQQTGEEQAVTVDYLATRLVSDGHRSTAYHLSRWSEDSLQGASHLPSWLLQALVLAPHVASTAGEIAVALRNACAQFDVGDTDTGDDGWDQGLALLLAASTLRPSLLAPTTLAPHVLKEIHFRSQTALWEYCNNIAEHAIAGDAIDPAVIAHVKDRAAWERSVAALQLETREWLGRAPNRTVLFPAGTAVWQVWQRKGGEIYELLEPVRANDVRRLPDVRLQIDVLSDPDQIRRLVDDRDRSIRGRPKWQPIQHKAYAQFQNYVREAVDLAVRWVDLHDMAPGERQDYRIAQADMLRREAIERHPQILAELDSLDAATSRAIVRAGTTALRDALKDVEQMFEGGARLSREEPRPDRLLNGSILRTRTINLSEEWRLIPDGPAAVGAAVLKLLAEGEVPDWHTVFARRSAAGDHVGSELALQIIEKLGPGSELDELRRHRLNAIDEGRRTLRRQTIEAQKAVEEAVMHGHLSETERSALAGRVAYVELGIDKQLAFHLLAAELDAVRAEVGRRRSIQVEQVRERLDAAQPPAVIRDRIAAVLAQGDVLTAQEYLHHFEADLPLPDAERAPDDVFDAFFPKSLRSLENWGTNRAQVVETIRARGDVAGLSLTQLTEPQAAQAADALQAWFRLGGRRGAVDPVALATVFSYFGFTNVEVSSAPDSPVGGGRVWAEVRTDAVRDRTRCPLPAFGSFAAGDFASTRARYRTLCIWDETSAEDLVGAASDFHGVPTFVLYFGRMGEDRRRRLARLSRASRRAFLVVDELLMLFLAAEQRSRMATLFACTLPFTHIEPFHTTSVPPELFYGREHERQRIMDRNGSSFIYGGRQLGKTALLRDVERRFHDPAQGRIAVYLDLKYKGIAFDRPVDDVWLVITESLKDAGVLDTNFSIHSTTTKVLEELRRWLDAAPERRILLLLDEADRFHEADSDFTRVTRLKGLMEDTDRRFKVVFAGLHNVQRMTRVANNPLPHLGEPLCIGPLFDRGEWRQARELVERPLRALGYRFESGDLVTRILSQTNYYPSLLQLYGTQLLQHVNRTDVEAFDSKTCPPYVITASNVEDAYLSKELWSHIKQRFQWTLDLDARYRIFAQIIALSVANDQPWTQRGLTAPEVRSQAIDFWPQGFRDDRSEESFRVLLDEMVGLGLLRLTDAGGYTLRNANVAMLMGAPEEIETALYEQMDKEPPAAYEPATFRRPLSEDVNRHYSPLTAQQESEIQDRSHGISVIFGTTAAGLEDVLPLLPRLFGQDYFQAFENLTEREAFREELAQLGARKRDGVTGYFVDSTNSWDGSWIEDAVEKVAGLRSKTSFARIIFVADPSVTWRLLHAKGASPIVPVYGNVSILTLRPWADAALRAWLDDQGVPANQREQYLKEIAELTGKWPALLYELERILRGVAAARWRGIFDTYRSTDGVDGSLNRRAHLFGLDIPDVQHVLTTLATVEPATVDEVVMMAELPDAAVADVLTWSELLGIGTQSGSGQWMVDPMVGRILRSRNTDEPLLVDTAGT